MLQGETVTCEQMILSCFTAIASLQVVQLLGKDKQTFLIIKYRALIY